MDIILLMYSGRQYIHDRPGAIVVSNDYTSRSIKNGSSNGQHILFTIMYESRMETFSDSMAHRTLPTITRVSLLRDTWLAKHISLATSNIANLSDQIV